MMRFSRALTVVTFISAIGMCLPSRAGTPEDQINHRLRVQIRSDIKAHGQTFSGPEVIPPALLKAIEGKRLVGIGEGTHGTSEIQTLLGNIILAMAKKGRVVVFLEDQFGSVAAINRFVQGIGEDNDLPISMNGLYGVHKTREFEDFFRAVRKFNETAPAGTKIEIYGVDNVIWPGPADPTPLLKLFCTANDLKADAELAICAAYFQDPKSQTPATRAACVSAAAKIRLVVDRVAPAVSGQVEATVMANVLVRNLQQDEAANGRFAATLVNKLGDGPFNTIINGSRDAGMAENIKILMDGKIPTTGVGVFWAHNAHIGRISYLDGDPIGCPSTWGNAGSILSTWLGNGYAPIATMTGKGTFRAHIVDKDGSVSLFQPATAPAINPDCLNAIASSVFSKPVFFATKAVSHLNSTRSEFAISAIYETRNPGHCFTTTVPAMAYAGIISFPVSTAAHEMSGLGSKPTHP